MIAADHAMIVILIDPAAAQPVRCGSQAENAQGWVIFLQMLYHLLILAVFAEADPVALINNQQGKFTVKIRRITGDRLHAAENDFL